MRVWKNELHENILGEQRTPFLPYYAAVLSVEGMKYYGPYDRTVGGARWGLLITCAACLLI
jgi:hypothetical protein